MTLDESGLRDGGPVGTFYENMFGVTWIDGGEVSGSVRNLRNTIVYLLNKPNINPEACNDAITTLDFNGCDFDGMISFVHSTPNNNIGVQLSTIDSTGNETIQSTGYMTGVLTYQVSIGKPIRKMILKVIGSCDDPQLWNLVWVDSVGLAGSFSNCVPLPVPINTTPTRTTPIIRVTPVLTSQQNLQPGPTPTPAPIFNKTPQRLLADDDQDDGMHFEDDNDRGDDDDERDWNNDDDEDVDDWMDRNREDDDDDRNNDDD